MICWCLHQRTIMYDRKNIRPSFFRGQNDVFEHVKLEHWTPRFGICFPNKKLRTTQHDLSADNSQSSICTHGLRRRTDDVHWPGFYVVTGHPCSAWLLKVSETSWLPPWFVSSVIGHANPEIAPQTAQSRSSDVAAWYSGASTYVSMY